MNLFDLTGETAVVIGGTGALGGVTDAGSLRRAHKQTGTPTILVNAAGGNDPKASVAFETIALDDWRANFDLNLVGGVLLPCQIFGAAKAAVLNHTGMNRFGEPRELVGAAIFLASAKASGFVTGTDIRVDGGFLCQTI
jgi:NAD(P)-dependent dehydrogenase (short-subunit alcohol dehydrogenase family)